MDGQFVDREGYPRSDIDVYEARRARNEKFFGSQPDKDKHYTICTCYHSYGGSPASTAVSIN